MTRSPIHIRYPLPPPTPPACTHVQNTVDILVGWHIDIQQDPQLIESISAALVCFREFWIKDMLFSTDLLKQFLEDMEAYCSVSVCGVVWCVCVWPVGPWGWSCGVCGGGGDINAKTSLHACTDHENYL